MKKEIKVTGLPFVSHVNQSLRPTLTTDFLKEDAYTRYYLSIIIGLLVISMILHLI